MGGRIEIENVRRHCRRVKVRKGNSGRRRGERRAFEGRLCVAQSNGRARPLKSRLLLWPLLIAHKQFQIFSLVAETQPNTSIPAAAGSLSCFSPYSNLIPRAAFLISGCHPSTIAILCLFVHSTALDFHSARTHCTSFSFAVLTSRSSFQSPPGLSSATTFSSFSSPHPHISLSSAILPNHLMHQSSPNIQRLFLLRPRANTPCLTAAHDPIARRNSFDFCLSPSRLHFQSHTHLT